MTKTELRNYRALSREVQQLEERLKTMESTMYTPKGQRFSHIPECWKTEEDKSMDDLVEKHHQLVSLYLKKLTAAKGDLLHIEQAISALAAVEERTVLRYRYVDGYNWDRICSVMHYSRTQAYRIHGYALQHLQKTEAPLVEDHDCSGLLE